MFLTLTLTCTATGRPIVRDETYFCSALSGEWTCWDLNPGPPPCKGGDLPADLQAHRLAAVTAFEARHKPVLVPCYSRLAVFRVFLASLAGSIYICVYGCGALVIVIDLAPRLRREIIVVRR